MMSEGNPHLNDRELEALAMQIDRLAFSDQTSEGLEARITAATLPLLQQSQVARPALRLVHADPAPDTVRRRFSRTPMRIAAGFALIATAGLTWVATRNAAPVSYGSGSSTLAVVNVSSDDWAFASSLLDDDLSDKITELHDETSTLGTSIQSHSLSDMLEEGAM